jgi:2-keto-4-pentenoate hydratase/2-oxohepta-3-ene-1,7-dioic acid hydratase in catechol pathway
LKLIRYAADDHVQYGVLDGSDIFAMDGDPFADFSIGRLIGTIRDVQLLPPCVPTKIIAVGLNYTDPSQDRLPPLPDEPILSFKPPSSAIGSGAPIVWPKTSSRVDFEGEVAVVIGRTARNVEPHDVARYVLGVTCANDVTARDLQRREGQWAKAKGFDTFCPLGPCIDTTVDPTSCTLITRVNREVRQSTSTESLHFGAYLLVSYISKIMTLCPGDVILTGTPPGTGPLKVGDVVEVEVEGVGVLWNPVVAEECRTNVRDNGTRSASEAGR